MEKSEIKIGVIARNVILCIVIAATVFVFGGCAADNGKVIKSRLFTACKRRTTINIYPEPI